MPDNLMEDHNSNYQSTAILKELGDIKTGQAVGSNEMKNISATITEIKADIKFIKDDFVNRREHNELIKTVSDQGKQLKQLEYWQAKAIGYGGGASVVVYYLLKFIK